MMKAEHHRWHCAEQWPDSPYKEAVTAAARAMLEHLEAAAVEPFELPVCMVCAAKKRQARVLTFPSRPKGCFATLQPAA